ncbi:MAG: hypothetical protein SD837_08165 [Candidatus Electrothrix scaldis]|nr:MAG: hypothetical protein SD837_08165 [Candidatus Electrothrix sp. GW3-3]
MAGSERSGKGIILYSTVAELIKISGIEKELAERRKKIQAGETLSHKEIWEQLS